jgi:SLT domain-containing protein
LKVIAQHESGGNPNAINNWDSNAKAGHPSMGLMQTIGPTFNAYALPGHKDIWNPVDNAIAAIRYIQARYRSVSNVPGVRALNSGGRYVGY